MARANAGEYPFLPAADDLLPDFDLMTKKPLGIMEIPTSMIVGTMLINACGHYIFEF